MTTDSNQLATEPRRPVPDRRCDGCTLCCEVMGVVELAKPQWRLCEHCVEGNGCKIYEQRPGDCKSYLCEYLKNAQLSDAWHPKIAHFVVEVQEVEINVYVDPRFPDAWRSEPYYSRFKNAAVRAGPKGGAVTVHVGLNYARIIFADLEIETQRHTPGQEATTTAAAKSRSGDQSRS